MGNKTDVTREESSERKKRLPYLRFYTTCASTFILSSCLTKNCCWKLSTISRYRKEYASAETAARHGYDMVRVPMYVINLIYYLWRGGKSAILPVVWTELHKENQTNWYRVVFCSPSVRPTVRLCMHANCIFIIILIICCCRKCRGNGHSAVASTTLRTHSVNKKHIHDEWLTAPEHVSGTKSSKEL